MKTTLVILFLLYFGFEGLCQQEASITLDKKTKKHVEKLLDESGLVIRSGPKEYKLFRKFKRNASVDELLQLIYHSSPEIRAYSFWALKDKDYPNLVSIINDQPINSEETFLYYIDRGGLTLEVEEATVKGFIMKLMNNEIK